MKRNKVFLISTVYPFPADTGKKVVLSGIVSYLVSRFGAENVVYILLGPASQLPMDRRVFPGTLLHLPKPGLLTQMANIVRFVLFRRRKSIQEALVFSRHTCAELESVILSYAPHAIIYDTVRIGQYLDHIHVDTVKDAVNLLYMEDLFSVRYEKMIDTIKRYRDIRMDPLGNFRTFLPSIISATMQLGKLQQWLLAVEQRLITASENRLPKRFDMSFLLNEGEVSELKKRSGIMTICQIKPLLTHVDSGNSRRNYRGNCEFVFLGSLSYPQNQIAIEYLITRKMSSIISLMPAVRLRIIGRGASPRLLKLAQQYAGHISIEGYVDDIARVFANACAMLVPLLFGSGIKLKTLEAFSYGLPVICTDYGVEGIPVADGIHCVIENDIDRFPERMVTLCNITDNNSMSQSCKDFFLANYSFLAVSKEYDGYFSLFRRQHHI